MDYDKIVEGRRRNWDELKPDEVRKEEREKRREEKRRDREEKIKTGKSTSFDHIRDQRKREQEQLDREKFRATVKRAAILGGIFFGTIFVWTMVSTYLNHRSREKSLLNMTTFTRVLDEGGEVNDLSTPVGALATWRSAWLREDMARVVNLYSPGELARRLKGPGKTRETIIREHRRMLAAGSLDVRRDLAGVMGMAEFVSVPRSPWKEGQLAIFRSPPIEQLGTEGAIRYTMAFSYAADQREWRFAEMRPSIYFNVNWDFESKIQPFRVGPMAAKYDDEGNMMKDESEKSQSGRGTF